MRLARATAASTVQSLQTCMYVPAGQSEREGMGGVSDKMQREGRREKEQRRVNGEYVESGGQDGGEPHCTCSQTQLHV